MRKLIKNNIARRKNQSVLTVLITFMTVFTFMLARGAFLAIQPWLAKYTNDLWRYPLWKVRNT